MAKLCADAEAEAYSAEQLDINDFVRNSNFLTALVNKREKHWNNLFDKWTEQYKDSEEDADARDAIDFSGGRVRISRGTKSLSSSLKVVPSSTSPRANKTLQGPSSVKRLQSPSSEKLPSYTKLRRVRKTQPDRVPVRRVSQRLNNELSSLSKQSTSAVGKESVSPSPLDSRPLNFHSLSDTASSAPVAADVLEDFPFTSDSHSHKSLRKNQTTISLQVFTKKRNRLSLDFAHTKQSPTETKSFQMSSPKNPSMSPKLVTRGPKSPQALQSSPTKSPTMSPKRVTRGPKSPQAPQSSPTKSLTMSPKVNTRGPKSPQAPQSSPTKSLTMSPKLVTRGPKSPQVLQSSPTKSPTTSPKLVTKSPTMSPKLNTRGPKTPQALQSSPTKSLTMSPKLVTRGPKTPQALQSSPTKSPTMSPKLVTRGPRSPQMSPIRSPAPVSAQRNTSGPKSPPQTVQMSSTKRPSMTPKRSTREAKSSQHVPVSFTKSSSEESNPDTSRTRKSTARKSRNTSGVGLLGNTSTPTPPEPNRDSLVSEDAWLDSPLGIRVRPYFIEPSSPEEMMEWNNSGNNWMDFSDLNLET